MATVRKRQWTDAKGGLKTAWAVDFIDQSGRRHRKHFSTKRKADSYRVEIEDQLRKGTFRPDASKVTLKELCASFLEHCKGRKERGERMTALNLKVYEGHVYNYICPDTERHKEGKRPARLRQFDKGIGALKFGNLSARRIGTFRDELRVAGVSVVTTRKILSTLHCILEYAISQDLVAVNAAKGVKVIGKRDDGPKKIIPPSKEAMKALIEAADQDFRVKLIFAAATGLRAGEFHALRWKHLDLNKGEVTVETRVDVYGSEDATKTEAGMRTIPIGQPVVRMLKEWLLRSNLKKSEDLVFPNSKGTYESHDNMIKREFNPLFKKLENAHKKDPSNHPKIQRFNWHALRHFAVSCWIEAGLSPKTIQSYAGHSSLQVTMDRYGHLFKSDDHKKVMDEIAMELFG
jgi:integrase